MEEINDEALAEEPEKEAKNQIVVSNSHTVDCSERTAHFVQAFLLPFWQVRDESPVIDDVLGPEVGRAFSQGVYAGSDQETLYERIFYKSNACAATDVPWPHTDALLLSVAAHDLIALADPKLSKRKRRKQIPLLEQTLALLPALERYDQLLVRWALLEQLGRCVRKDTTVRFWVGKRVFRGRDVPKRILVFPRLRRVRTSTQNVSLQDVWPSELDAPLNAFWAASPVSWLCNAYRWIESEQRPDNRLLVAVLRDPALRAFVAETTCEQELGWLSWLHAAADEPLRQSLVSLALDLRAYGARHDALNELLDAIPAQTISLFDERIARSNLAMSPNNINRTEH